MTKRLVVAVIFSFIVGVEVNSYAADRTLAVVNGEAIFESEFNVVANPLIEQYKGTTPPEAQNVAEINQRKDAVLERLVEFTLLKQDAKKNKVVVTSQEIRDAMSQIKQSFNNNDAAFNEALKRENLTRAKFESRIADQLMVNKYVNQTIERQVPKPTEEQVKSFYDKVKQKDRGQSTGLSAEDDQFASQVAIWLKRFTGDQARVRQIFVSAPKGANPDQLKNAEAKVEEIKKQLSASNGNNFAQVAGQFSEDGATRQNGGDLGTIAKGDLVPAIDNVVFKLRAGRYTATPIKLDDSGYYFFKVEEKIAPKTVNFDDVKGQMLNAYFQNEANKYYAKFVGQLRAKANIKLNKDW
jgi:parvulin-like peptidyl-prolyl isomerase